MVTFNDKNDVWVYINDLVNESKQRGSKFNILQDIYEQLPFFVCFNMILDQIIKKIYLCICIVVKLECHRIKAHMDNNQNYGYKSIT